jgi:hypothetical protein
MDRDQVAERARSLLGFPPGWLGLSKADSLLFSSVLVALALMAEASSSCKQGSEHVQHNDHPARSVLISFPWIVPDRRFGRQTFQLEFLKHATI